MAQVNNATAAIDGGFMMMDPVVAARLKHRNLKNSNTVNVSGICANKTK